MQRRHTISHGLAAVLLIALPLAAKVLPVDLPVPDDQPPARDKPVKVYILSGQSNMLGFGRIEGAAPFYSNVFLSADPSVTECTLPVDNAALMRFRVFSEARGGREGHATASLWDIIVDELKGPAKTEVIPFGRAGAMLPDPGQMRTLAVTAHIEVPHDGNYLVHVGSGKSRHGVATLDGREVYRRNPGSDAVLTKASLSGNKRHKLEIHYFDKGGPAALWLERVDLEGMGDLRWAVEKLGRFPCMLDDHGEWTVRHDVMLNDAYMGKGKSAPLSAPACGSTFGPELGFGYVMGAFHEEPVIVMKADIGNRSLGWDILPPGSESYTHEGQNYPGYGEKLDENGEVVKWDGEGWYAGKQYDDYTAAIRAVLDNFDEKYPEYAGQGFEVAGFAWWQGHKDGGNPGHIARYEQNLVNLIKAWRKEFEAPEAKWAIATVGFEGGEMPEHYVKILEAQKAVADPGRHPELAGTVKTIDTRPFWRGPEVSPKNQGYHYHHNGETYMLTGDALGRAMVELHGGEVEYPPGKMDEATSAVPNLPRPTAGQLEAMQAALRPIVLDKLIPEYVASAPGTPAYRRGGMELVSILGEKFPEKPTAQLGSQLDRVIGYYRLVGIDDYDWKPFGPEMRLAEWNYLSFDPAEKKEDFKGDRYREITLPNGSENWTAPDFDAAEAGWKTGKAPFGQNNGEQEALRSRCGNPHCHCDVTPSTLWDREVLLIRQDFDIPGFEEGKRYRIVVGGAGHTWSGEGFALHVNGKQVAEMTGGYYKGGGAPRGSYIFGDLKSEMAGRKATIAVKAFLRQNGHRNKPAPPSGHLSVWLEEATLPSAAMAAMPKE